MDKEMAYRVWHEDGTADYDAIFEGTGHGFVDWVWEAHEPMDAHSHQMTNILIEVDGDGATSATYAIVTLRTKRAPDGSASLITSRGRYLDRWSRRGGVWAIDHRVHVQDVSSTETIPAERVEDSTPRATRDGGFPCHFVSKPLQSLVVLDIPEPAREARRRESPLLGKTSTRSEAKILGINCFEEKCV